MSTVGDENSLIFSRLATYMNERPDFIDSAMISELERLYGVCTEEAFSLLLCAALGFDTSFESDRLLWERYAPHMLHRLDEAYFSADPFAAAVGAGERAFGSLCTVFCRRVRLLPAAIR